MSRLSTRAGSRGPVRTAVLLPWICGVAAGPAPAADYLAEIKPLLRERCQSCHGALQQKGGLRLDTAAFLLQGGDSGPGADLDHPANSRILQRLRAADPAERMPQESAPLSDAQIAAIAAWLDAGAPAPENESPEEDPRRHWAFLPPDKPPLPPSPSGANPIDAFLGQAWATAGVAPQPAATPETRLRRLFLGLTGLPPSRADLHDFLQDPSPEAYNRLADRLLASPAHAERWTRHWMDVWRYSDWHGLGDQLRYSQKHIWRWRDWILDSLEADKGYDVMIREMLAGDELAPGDPDVVRATGFLARNYYLFNRTTWLDSTIEHTGKAFLGLTLNCAKCHDHKYDPVTQEDYYRFRAVFEPHQVRLDAVDGETDFERDGLPRAYDEHADLPTYLHRRGNEKDPDTALPLAPGVPAFLGLADLQVAPVTLPQTAWAPGLQPAVRARLIADADQALRLAEEACNAAPAQDPEAVALAAARREAARLGRESLELRLQAEAARHTTEDAARADTLARDAARAERRAAAASAEAGLLDVNRRLAAETDPGRKESLAKEQGETQARLDAARQALADPGNGYTPVRGSRKALESPADSADAYPAVYPNVSTGRRLALARWITDPRHPLTARVAVNHIWLRHFGEPLVPAVSDFGRRSPRPPLHELLDYLAADFMEHGWSMRRLHRLIVTSEAYARSSSLRDAAPESLRQDPDNRLFWHAPARRLQAQDVRDVLLATSGQLDHTVGGPSLDPDQPGAPPRRSLYFLHSRDDQHRFLALFDDAPIQECYRRSESVVPQQALALINSAEVLQAAAELAKALQADPANASDSAFVQAAFETVLSRSPDPEEERICAEALAEFRLLAGSGEASAAPARARLIQALFNHNEWITVR